MPTTIAAHVSASEAAAPVAGWTSEQRHVVAASFLGWTLDAFDFFLLVFVLKDIAAEFRTMLPMSALPSC